MREHDDREITRPLQEIIRRHERMLDRFKGRIVRSQLIDRPDLRLIRTAEEHVRWYSDQLLVLKEELRSVERMFGGTPQLRKTTERDIRRIWQWSNRAEVRRLLRRPAYSLEKWTGDVHAWLADESAYPFSIDKPTGDHIGFLLLKKLKVEPEVGTAQLDRVLIDEEYWEFGYGAEAVEAVVSFAFDELGVDSVSLRTAADNGGAVRCFEKCGFTVADVETDVVAENGETRDVYEMTLGRATLRDKDLQGEEGWTLGESRTP